jgi:hypothetical protein
VGACTILLAASVWFFLHGGPHRETTPIVNDATTRAVAQETAPTTTQNNGPALLSIPSDTDLSGLAENDRNKALDLAKTISEGKGGDATVIEADTLWRRYPNDPFAAQLLRAALLGAVDRALGTRSFKQARELLDRASILSPDDPEVARSFLRLLAEMGDWPSAEALAAKVLAADSTSPDGRRALALALAGQGRDRDALRAIYAALEVVKDASDQPGLRELRDQIERRLWVTSGCETSQLPDVAREGDATARAEKFLALAGGCVGGNIGQRLAHFSVGFKRLDGPIVEAQGANVASVETVSRKLMPLLEQHYATLTSILSHEVKHPIPVIFLEDAEYRLSTGAPTWAGGEYDRDDKTITIPLGVVDRIEFKDPVVEQQWSTRKEYLASMVLIHEVTHAFVDDITLGTAPREMQEGLAQYLEREVTKDRTDLAIKIEEAAKDRARGSLSPPIQEGELQRRTAVLLGGVVEELRGAGIKHADSLISVYTGGELFVEYLVKQRSMAGIQTLLQSMRETRSVDESFSLVYGQSMDGARRVWLDRLRQQWGAGAARRE